MSDAMVSGDSDEDHKERDQFAERLKKKDQDKTRNIAIPRPGIFDCFSKSIINFCWQRNRNLQYNIVNFICPLCQSDWQYSKQFSKIIL